MKGAVPFSTSHSITLKFDSFYQFYFIKTVKNFSVKSMALRREQPLSYTEQFLFVLSFNVAPYFQLKKLVFYFNFWTFFN